MKTALMNGKPILLYDSKDRESEVDMVFHPKYFSFKSVQHMRKDAGGLICFVIGKEINRIIKLPKMTQILRKTIDRNIIYETTPYGDEPAFSIYVNHKSERTGIPDMDRWKTMHELSKLSEIEDPLHFFTLNFRTPGHVPLLIDSGLRKRRGHTELSAELMRTLGLTPTAVVCEMLGNDGLSMNTETAKNYANRNNLLFLDGGNL